MIFSLFTWLPPVVVIAIKFAFVAMFVLALAKLFAIVWDAIPFV